MISKAEPNPDQKKALHLLRGPQNIFLTGPAGTGKSFIINRYLDSQQNHPPILATTGAAAVLIGGRTFHSFFGLGIMEGGIEETVQRASAHYRVKTRINKTKEIIIDEISMIHPQAFEAANRIAKKIKGNESPFGGIRLILIGDFFQLPPVDRFDKKLPSIFNTDLWHSLELTLLELTVSMRTSNKDFIKILNKVRYGQCDQEVQDFLNSRVSALKDGFSGTVLFGRRVDAENYNQNKIDQIKGDLIKFETEVITSPKNKISRENLIVYSPLPPVLFVKEKSLVMIRKNDPEGEYVNGSLGLIKKITPEKISVELLSGKSVDIVKEDFQILDGDGFTVAVIRNFPLTLGWATTIHKSQGSSIDRLHINLKGLWEFGQAYVALSRAKDPSQLFIESWGAGSIKADPNVVKFYLESKVIS